MKLLQTTALCLTALLAAPAAHAEMVALSDLEVRTDLSDFENSNAMDYWPDLAADLGLAIGERVDLSGDAEYPSVVVEVIKIAVDGNVVLPDTGEFNELQGIVKVFPGETVETTGQNNRGVDEPVQNYPILLRAVAGDATPVEGWVTIPPSQDDFYNAMINAFAAEVVENMDAPGGG